MVNGRYDQGQRRISSSLIEEKSIEIEWLREDNRGGYVLIKESSRRGVFRAELSLDGGKWLGKLLCQISVGLTSLGTSFRLPETMGSITGTLKENRGGRFLQLTIFRRGAQKKFSTICFPEGRGSKGWGAVGSDIRALLEGRTLGTEQRVGQPQELRASRSYKEMVVPHERREESYVKKVTIKGLNDAMQKSWWSPVVICNSNCQNPDWVWAEKKIKSVFPQAIFKLQRKNEALVIFQTKEEAVSLINMPPLVNWEGSFSFSAWTAEAGSIALDAWKMLEKKIIVSFVGIPYHLRTNAVIAEIAKECAKRWKIVEESINISSTRCLVELFDSELWRIPRVVHVQERGISSPVFIEVEGVEKLTGGSFSASQYQTLNQAGFGQRLVINPLVNVETEGSNQIAVPRPSPTQSRPPGFMQAIDNNMSGDASTNRTRQMGAVPVETSNPFALLVVQDNQSGSLMNTSEQGKEKEILFEDRGDFQADLGKDFEAQPDEDPIQPYRKPRVQKKTPKRAQDWPGLWPNKLWMVSSQRARSLSRGPRRSKSRSRIQNGSGSIIGEDNNNGASSSSTSIQILSRDKVITPSFSSNPAVDVVAESPVSETKEVVMPSQGEIAESLFRCEEDMDSSNLIKWVVLPLAKKAGLTSSLGKEGLYRLFMEINGEQYNRKQGEQQKDLQAIETEFEPANPMGQGIDASDHVD
ncbi:hypothetical protein FRX31_025985 [Thalictrum thalictroides]|uniref:DUF4283 domain-containing protein n=1 Tax=Thalictrum thalictroides TaxID=46969 RepID=A0A7J6VH50_THATH|nr:hypothetical protein FRX31_025985 [Thalictrum thalictroides]